MLVWAFNESLPYPRRLAAGVRVMVLFVAIVVAADHLDFARVVFLTVFIIFVGGLVLTISLAFGIGASGRVRGYFKDKTKRTTRKRNARSGRIYERNVTGIDQAVLIVYIGCMIGMSLLIARRQHSGDQYFLAGRSMGHVKLAMSVIANQVSAVSLIGAPAFVALQANGGLKWLQYEIAVPIAMIVLIAIIVPILRSVQGASIYEFAEWRFGSGTRQLLALAFLISRGLALGVILYASAAVIAPIFQTSLDTAIAFVGLVAAVYTTLGGIVADIWTDVIQLLVLWAGTLASVVFLGTYCGGVLWSLIPEDRSQTLILDSTGFAGSGDFGFWPMLFGGLFLYVSYYGCYQVRPRDC